MPVQDSSGVALTVVAHTWGHAAHELPLFLHSCALQTSKDFKVVVCHDESWTDPDLHTRDSARLSERFCGNFEGVQLEFKCITPRRNDSGYSFRQESLGWIDTKYFMWLNIGGHLDPRFVSWFVSRMEDKNCDLLKHFTGTAFCAKTEWAKKEKFNYAGNFLTDIKVKGLMDWHGSEAKICIE